MLSQNPLVQVDEDELLEELEALTEKNQEVEEEIIELPSVPIGPIKQSNRLESVESENKRKMELLTE